MGGKTIDNLLPRQGAQGFWAAWTFLALIWIGVTGSLDPVSFIFGLVFTGGVAFLSARQTTFWAGLDLSFGRVRAGITYLAVFCREVILSNLAVLRFVYSKHLHVSSENIEVDLRIRGQRERFALTSTVALTPGTLVIDLRKDHAEVNVLDKRQSKDVPGGIHMFENLLEKAIG